MGNSIAISQLSLEYVSVPVTVTTLAGAAYNPTADQVVMAFMPQPSQYPQPTDWVGAIWSTNTNNVLYPYAVNCLVGPGGTITLGVGTYTIYVKITDNPEIPVERAPLQLMVY